jgi:hypothetical protein
MSTIHGQTAADFERAHNRAFFRKLFAIIAGRSDEVKLLSFDEVKEKLGWRNEHYIGLRTVPVAAIVGSVGRYRDFDRAFLPVQRATRRRWQSIDEAYYRDVSLPPVQLYKVGDVYFVRDGNHRVSVAREKGVMFIDAEVIECETSVPLTPDVTVDDLDAIAEYADFLDWSRLDRLRPDQDIHFTIPGGYDQLREHISVHRYYLGLERKAPVPLEEAVLSWYDNLYMPVARLAREENFLDKFPNRSEADLYLWIMDHLYFLRQRYGEAVDAEDAAADFAEHFGRQPLLETLRERLTALSRIGAD